MPGMHGWGAATTSNSSSLRMHIQLPAGCSRSPLLSRTHRCSTVSSKQALSGLGRGQRRKVCRPPCWVLNQILMAITAGSRVGAGRGGGQQLQGSCRRCKRRACTRCDFWQVWHAGTGLWVGEGASGAALRASAGPNLSRRCRWPGWVPLLRGRLCRTSGASSWARSAFRLPSSQRGRRCSGSAGSTCRTGQVAGGHWHQPHMCTTSRHRHLPLGGMARRHARELNTLHRGSHSLPVGGKVAGSRRRHEGVPIGSMGRQEQGKGQGCRRRRRQGHGPPVRGPRPAAWCPPPIRNGPIRSSTASVEGAQRTRAAVRRKCARQNPRSRRRAFLGANCALRAQQPRCAGGLLTSIPSAGRLPGWLLHGKGVPKAVCRPANPHKFKQ